MCICETEFELVVLSTTCFGSKFMVETFILLAKVRVVANVILMGIAIHKAYLGFGAVYYLCFAIWRIQVYADKMEKR
ncbi:hypothetical protein HPB50_004491 [Hyalomma asiaticum]|uniref:Uncharacterized protein n=1 Tax=Hyalomma asiaticum TaxID=266040 RepID=A0ACB7RHA1_HYAAI|nr:hypothetical protein HPB50_004491 [Hyalomma asiaticum]